jgi:hypothetical protein
LKNTRDLPACSIDPQPITLQHTGRKESNRHGLCQISHRRKPRATGYTKHTHDMSAPAAQQHTRLAAPGSKEKGAAGAKLTLKTGFRSSSRRDDGLMGGTNHFQRVGQLRHETYLVPGHAHNEGDELVSVPL